MRTVSLRLRVTVATLVVLALSLAGFAVAVTLHYRSGLEHDLRNRLIAGGLALQRTSPTDLKQLMSSLALEGIDVNLGDPRRARDEAGRWETPAACDRSGAGNLHR